jgi:hypothetical protein
MRNGLRSSRGAMRGTMGGAPICRIGAVGFATVAIGVGPFVNSFYAACFLLMKLELCYWYRFEWARKS